MGKCEIVPYGGFGALCNTVLLNFVKNRFRKFFVTYDLDAEDKVEKTLKTLQLERGKDYLPIGLSSAGKRCIEGLLPESVRTAVYGANPDLVQAATNGTKDEKNAASEALKRLLLDEFKGKAVPGEEYFQHFYLLVKRVNAAFK